MFTKRRIAMWVAEFIGTALLALVVLSLINSYLGALNLGPGAQYPIVFGGELFLALAAGVGLAMLVLVFGRVSGSLFNPAITISLWTVRQISALRMIAFVVAQLLGGVVAFLVHQYLVGGDYNWGTQALGYDGPVLVAEVIGSAVLAFGFAAALYRGFSGGSRAATIGAAYAVGIIIAGIASVGLLNPAIAFANQSWELTTYVLGPVLGAIIGFNVYNLLFGAATAPVVVAGSSVATAAPVAKKPTVKTVTKATPTKTATKSVAKTTNKSATTKKK